MKYIKLYILVVFCIGFLIAIFFPVRGTSATLNESHIDISTVPTSSFMEVYNMAPGDTFTNKLIVNNNGNVDINYSLNARKESGNQNLYEQLKVIIEREKQVVYEGYIKAINNHHLGEISSFNGDELLFTIELPINVGNEVKKKNTSIALDFTALGYLNPNASGVGTLPKTTTNIFNYLLIGILLVGTGVSFYLYYFRKRNK